MTSSELWGTSNHSIMKAIFVWYSSLWENLSMISSKWMTFEDFLYHLFNLSSLRSLNRSVFYIETAILILTSNQKTSFSKMHHTSNQVLISHFEHPTPLLDIIIHFKSGHFTYPYQIQSRLLTLVEPPDMMTTTAQLLILDNIDRLK